MCPHSAKPPIGAAVCLQIISASGMTYIVSGGALNSTYSLAMTMTMVIGVHHETGVLLISSSSSLKPECNADIWRNNVFALYAVYILLL